MLKYRLVASVTFLGQLASLFLCAEIEGEKNHPRSGSWTDGAVWIRRFSVVRIKAFKIKNIMTVKIFNGMGNFC